MSPPTPVSQFPTLVFNRSVILGIFRKGRTLLIHHFEIKCRNINIGLSKCSVAFFDSTRNMYIGVLLLGLASCFALSTIACLHYLVLTCLLGTLLACSLNKGDSLHPSAPPPHKWAQPRWNCAK